MRTNRTLLIYQFLLIGVFLVFVSSCKKDDDADISNISLPVLTTTIVTDISQTSAISGGNISSNGGGVVTAIGVCWATSTEPTISDNKTTEVTAIGSFTSTITELIPNTTYYVRAYATNTKGTGYGSTISFTTLGSNSTSIIFNPDITYGTVSDIDGNTYKTVTIGTQTWMAENLRTTKYNDGSNIPNITSNSEWGSTTTGAQCTYNNTSNGDTIATFGRLYNWHAVNTGKLCPTGWHIPTDAEWTTLTIYLGYEISGGKLKEMGTGNWDSPNTGATNESGFTALPSGRRVDGTFMQIRQWGFWWTTTELSANSIANREIGYNNAGVFNFGYPKESGFSVRCVKD